MNADVISEYGICCANDTQELVQYVDRELRNGYQPYGFVFTSVKGKELFYHQAMVKISSPLKNTKSINTKNKLLQKPAGERSSGTRLKTLVKKKSNAKK